MKTNHTPAPWKIGDDGPIHYEGMLRPVWNIYGGGPLDGRLVGSVEHFKEDGYPNANACLMSAAPDLLAAHKPNLIRETIELFEVLGRHEAANSWRAVLQLTEAAIAKAEGR